MHNIATKETLSNAQSVEILLCIPNARFQVPFRKAATKNEVLQRPSRQLFIKVRHDSILPFRLQFRIQIRSTFWPCKL